MNNGGNLNRASNVSPTNVQMNVNHGNIVGVMNGMSPSMVVPPQQGQGQMGIVDPNMLMMGQNGQGHMLPNNGIHPAMHGPPMRQGQQITSQGGQPPAQGQQGQFFPQQQNPLMMVRPGSVNPQQMATLQQIQNTYGTIGDSLQRGSISGASNSSIPVSETNGHIPDTHKVYQAAPYGAGPQKMDGQQRFYPPQPMPQQHQQHQHHHLPHQQQHPQHPQQQQQQQQHQPQMGGVPMAPPQSTLKKQISNFAMLKFIEFCESAGMRADAESLAYWRQLANEYFSDSGMLAFTLRNGSEQRRYDFSLPLISRFYYSIIQSGVAKFEMTPSLMKATVLATGATYLECSRMSMRHWYADGSYVTLYGMARVMFNQQLKIDWLEMQAFHSIPGLEWPTIEKSLVQNKFGNADFKDQQQAQVTMREVKSQFQVFRSLSNFGFQESVMRVMQISDVMAHLKTLMQFYTSSDCVGPLNALETFNKANVDPKQRKQVVQPPVRAQGAPFHQQAALQSLVQHQFQLQQQQKQQVQPSPRLKKATRSPSPKTVFKDESGEKRGYEDKSSGDGTPEAKDMLMFNTGSTNLYLNQSTLTKRRKLNNSRNNLVAAAEEASKSPGDKKMNM